jgi:hypothetical protein
MSRGQLRGRRALAASRPAAGVAAAIGSICPLFSACCAGLLPRDPEKLSGQTEGWINLAMEDGEGEQAWAGCGGGSGV